MADMNNKIYLFDENLENILSDEEYERHPDRKNGVFGKMADAAVHNKLYRQVSTVSHAVAQFIVDGGFAISDSDPNGMNQNFKQAIINILNGVINSRVPNMRASSTQYKIGDCVTDASIPLWAELECIQLGTTSANPFPMPATIKGIGEQIADGTVLWALRSKRFKLALKTPTPFVGSWTAPVLTGGVVTTPAYPVHQELGLPMLDCRFCDGTNGTINMCERVLRCKNSVDDVDIDSGADYYPLSKANLPTDTFNTTSQAVNFNFTTSAGGGHGHTKADGSSFYGTHAGGGQGGDQIPRITSPTALTGGEHSHSGSASITNLSLAFKLNDKRTDISTIPRNRQLAFIQRVY